jgi:hypothetical protein
MGMLQQASHPTINTLSFFDGTVATDGSDISTRDDATT